MMVVQCQACNKIKKFGEWIEIPEVLREVIKDVTVTVNTLCPHCQGNVLLMPSQDRVVLKQADADVVNVVSLT